eukprot:TRINITY_DN1708_c0_g2_i1.p1 TRINITY_DN1708_c0_g2~~TRINITY_DN1708_c0_g2_i1.p1  ORF type:complete len:124 (+),score=17.94 TRINITY_DN1708_c0_g2_i1:59-430(+)
MQSLGSTSISCPGVLIDYGCTTPADLIKDTICAVYSSIIPSISKTPFWPTPIPFTQALTPAHAAPIVDFKNHEYHSVLYMNSESMGVKWEWFNESILPTCQLVFNNLAHIVNQNGSVSYKSFI